MINEKLMYDFYSNGFSCLSTIRIANFHLKVLAGFTTACHKRNCFHSFNHFCNYYLFYFSERHRQGQMSPFICQLLTRGEIKLPVLLEGDVLPPVHKFYQPLRQNVYAVLFNIYHARYGLK